MIVKHRLNLDLIKRGVAQRIDAVQCDRYSRELEMHLFANGVEFAPPEDCTVLVRYKKPDGIGGAYDSLPDGECAWSIADGVLTVALAPQVCTVAGTVELAVTLLRETAEISTFMLLVDVQESPGGTESSREYVNIKAFLPQPGNVIVGQYLMVTEVDAYGNATVIGSGDGGAASVELTGAQALPYTAQPTVTEVAGSNYWTRKYQLGIPAGVPGYTPVRGLDYWTAEDYAVMQQENRDYLTGELAKRAQIAPLFADAVAECTDTDSIYVLPDGYIYAYMDGSWVNTGHVFMPKGEAGADGAQGPQGEKGEKGDPGKDGTDIVKCSYVTGMLPAGRAKGDVNGDGAVDDEDASIIRQYSVGAVEIKDPVSMWAADMDGDGYVDSFDASSIYKSQYAADYYGNWSYDSENGYYYFDIAVPDMTADTGVTVIPAKTLRAFVEAIPMDGALRFCIKGCPVEETLCRILYGGDLVGVTVENGVENSVLDMAKGEPGHTPVKGVDYFTDAEKNEMVNAVLAALPVYDGEVVEE